MVAHPDVMKIVIANNGVINFFMICPLDKSAKDIHLKNLVKDFVLANKKSAEALFLFSQFVVWRWISSFLF